MGKEISQGNFLADIAPKTLTQPGGSSGPLLPWNRNEHVFLEVEGFQAAIGPGAGESRAGPPEEEENQKEWMCKCCR